jgi:geranylgeranyl diphosphate synthase type II
MIHTYSLIHDDLPAMDDDKVRRGKPTLHVQFDEATAILAGDALLTLAFQILSDAQYKAPEEHYKRLQIIHSVAAAAGCSGMIDGQMLDMISEGKNLNVHDIKLLHRKKTGALIEVSVFSGALMGGAMIKKWQRLISMRAVSAWPSRWQMISSMSLATLIKWAKPWVRMQTGTRTRSHRSWACPNPRNMPGC